MSNKHNDIRMYVERLFCGQTLTAETIDLKEEVFANLVARYEDYLAEGMAEDEAFARTCEAVTSIDDVLGSEKDADPAAPVDATLVAAPVAAPVAVAEPVPEPAPAPVPTPAFSEKPKRPAWKTALVAVGCVAAVAVVCAAAMAALGAFDPAKSQTSTTQTTTAVSEPQGVNANRGPNEAPGSSGGASAQITADSAPLLTTDGLDQSITGHDHSHLVDHHSEHGSSATTDQEATILMGQLPLCDYLGNVSFSDVDQTTLQVDYAYCTDERQAHVDDDAIERALAYNAMAVLCAEPEVNAFEVRLNDTDLEDRELDIERYRFERTDLERRLNTVLSGDRLTDGSWDGLRDQIMNTHVYDDIVDRAELD